MRLSVMSKNFQVGSTTQLVSEALTWNAAYIQQACITVGFLNSEDPIRHEDCVDNKQDSLLKLTYILEAG